MQCNECVFKGKQLSYSGDIKSDLVIIVEAPSIVDLAKRRLLADEKGEMLFNIFKPAADPLIISAIACLPKQKTAKQLAKACQACNPRMIDIIKKHPRKLIITLGNGAIQSITGDYNLKITKIRGTVYASPMATKGILATFSPSFILKGGGNMQQFRTDLEHATQLYTETILDYMRKDINKQFVEGEYVVIKNATQLQELLTRINNAEGFIGYDIETDGFNPRRSELGILCIGVSFGKDNTYVIPSEFICDELFQTQAKQCWHNGKFDIGWLWYYGYRSARVDHDSMLMSYVLNERGGIHDLEQVGHDWLQAPNYKNMLEEYLPSKKSSYAVIPKDKLYHYQAIDAQLTVELCHTLLPHIMNENLIKVYENVIIPASYFLARVEENGFYTDQDVIEDNLKQLGAEMKDAEKRFLEAAAIYGDEFKDLNIRSPKQLKHLLYTTLELAPYDTKTNADTLNALPAHPVLEPLLQYRKLQKLVSTYVLPAKEKTDDDHRIHTTFKLHGTTTGRLSSNKPNLQNIPRDKRIRAQFAASPAHILIDCDLSQAELRVLACLSNDENMISIFSEGRSIHDEMATKLFSADFNKEQKMIAKNVNFGIIYGITQYGLAEQINTKAQAQGSSLKVTLAEANEWIEGWYDTFPQASKFIKECRAIPTLLGTLVSPFGRKRRFTSCGKDKMYMLQNEAANFPEQSTAHDITLVTGIKTIDVLHQTYNAKIVNEVHDCLLIETPDDMRIILEVAKLVTDTMKAVPKEYGLTQVPFESDPEVSYNWGYGEPLDMGLYNIRAELSGITFKEWSQSNGK